MTDFQTYLQILQLIPVDFEISEEVGGYRKVRINHAAMNQKSKPGYKPSNALWTTLRTECIFDEEGFYCGGTY